MMAVDCLEGENMKKRILLIEDDEEYIGPQLVRELTEAGHEVTHATNFKAAQILIEDDSKSFDAVVCDQNFPMFAESKHNTRPLGIELIRHARGYGGDRYQATPFILHTGEEGDDIKERCSKLNIQYCYKQYGVSFSKLFALLQ